MASAEKLASGLYRGVYRDAQGKKCHTKRPHYKKQRDAKARATELEVEARRQASHSPGSTSADILWGEWWDQSAPNRVFESETHIVERYLVERFLRPKWGQYPLNKITRADVQSWVDELKVGKKPSYVQKIYGVFSVSISTAMDPRNAVLLSSPCAGIVVPKRRKQPKAFMTVEQVEATKAVYLRPEYADAVEFTLEVGLRPGELGGLHLRGVDLEGGWVEVTDTLVRGQAVDSYMFIRGWPKDKDARRIPMTDKAIEIVRRRIHGRDMTKGCGIRHSDGSHCDSELVFRSHLKRPIKASNLRRILKDAMTAAKIEPKTPYSVRRGWATRLADGGANAFELAEWGGWADLKMAAEYVQRGPGARDRLRAAMGERDSLAVVEGTGTQAGTDPPPWATKCDQAPGDEKTG